MKPTVSVIIPAFNEEKYIKQCIDALEKQDYPKEKIELIVIDNGSNDNTPEIVNKTSARLYFKINCNVGAVRNHGAKIATGEVFAFIDADSIAPKNWISKGVARLLEKDRVVIGGGCKLPDNANWIEKSWLLGDDVKRLPKSLLGTSIFIFKNHFFNVEGFNEQVTSGEDTLLSDDLKKAGLSIEMNEELSVIHLGNAKSISTFLSRQAWHSENYFKNIVQSLKDPTFLLIILHIFTTFALACSLLLGKGISTELIIVLLFIPVIFSAKRMFRAGIFSIRITALLQIYTLDLLYVIGRDYGVIKSLVYKK